MEGDEGVEVVDMLPARLSTTAQPPDDVVLSTYFLVWFTPEVES